MFTEVSTKNEFYKQPDGAISSYGSTWHNKRIRKRIHVLNHSIVLTLSAAFPTHFVTRGKLICLSQRKSAPDRAKQPKPEAFLCQGWHHADPPLPLKPAFFLGLNGD
jgi:hypothetical protein